MGATWMMGGAGMLYRQSPSRLCSSYLRDDQLYAGTAVMVLAVAALIAWLRHVLRAVPMEGSGASRS